MMRLYFFVLFLSVLCAPMRGYATAVDNETHNYGSACTTNKANGADWDTIFQCNGGVWQRAPYFFGASASACDAAHAGVVQWTGTSLQVCSGSGWLTVASAAGSSSSSPGTSCASLLAQGVAADGVYWIKPDGGDAFQVYCDMSHDGGGWTLIMRIGSSSTFLYGSSYWTDQNTLNPTDFAPDTNADAKYPSFYRLTGATLRGCNAGRAMCVTMSVPTETAQNLFAGGSINGNYMARATLVSLYPPNDTSEPNCNVNGVDVYQGGSSSLYAWARFGLVGNNEADCGTPDTAWGWGIGSTVFSLQCGAGTVGWYGGGSGGQTCAQGTLWVR